MVKYYRIAATINKRTRTITVAAINANDAIEGARSLLQTNVLKTQRMTAQQRRRLEKEPRKVDYITPAARAKTIESLIPPARRLM